MMLMTTIDNDTQKMLAMIPIMSMVIIDDDNINENNKGDIINALMTVTMMDTDMV